MHDPSMKAVSANIKWRDSQYHHVERWAALKDPDWHIATRVRWDGPRAARPMQTLNT